MTTGVLYKKYQSAMLALRAHWCKDGCPIPLEVFTKVHSQAVVANLVDEGSAELIKECFKTADGQIKAGIVITWKGLWLSYRMVHKPKKVL